MQRILGLRSTPALPATGTRRQHLHLHLHLHLHQHHRHLHKSAYQRACHSQFHSQLHSQFHSQSHRQSQNQRLVPRQSQFGRIVSRTSRSIQSTPFNNNNNNNTQHLNETASPHPQEHHHIDTPSSSQTQTEPSLSQSQSQSQSHPTAYSQYVSKVNKGEARSRAKQIKRESHATECIKSHQEVLEGSHKVVALAITSNAIMFSAKLYAATISGSASMFAESLHSLADMLNESLLMIGIRRSLRKPDKNHPYGFSSERSAWALVSGVGIFFLGGGVSMYHGIQGILNPHVMGDPLVAQYVLALSLVFEVVTMGYAYRQISKTAAASGVSVIEYIKHGSDPTAVQVFLEDCCAVLGICIASASVTLSQILHLPILDSIGSIAIGALLGSLSVFLVRRNIAGLVERAMPINRQKEIERLLEQDPVIKSLHDVKTTQIGPEWVRFKAEVLFDGEEVTRRYLNQRPMTLTQELSIVQNISSEQELERYLIQHGGRVVSKLGKEVDRIELELKEKAPEVKHCDLEIL